MKTSYKFFFKDLAQSIADFYGVDVDLVTNKIKTRKMEVVRGRQMLTTLLKQHTDLSLKKIGRMLNNQDHSTVINTIKKCNDYYDVDIDYRNDYNKLNEVAKELKTTTLIHPVKLHFMYDSMNIQETFRI